MNDITLLTRTLKLKLVLIEKSHFYTHGDLIRSEPFDKSEKVHLKEFQGDDLKGIVKELNESVDKTTAIIRINGDGSVGNTGKNGKMKIQCMIV